MREKTKKRWWKMAEKIGDRKLNIIKTEFGNRKANEDSSRVHKMGWQEEKAKDMGSITKSWKT